MTPVRLEPAVLRSRFKHSTTEPLRSLGHTFANSGNPDETAPYEPSHQDFHCLLNAVNLCFQQGRCPNLHDVRRYLTLLYRPSHKMLVLIALSSNHVSGEPVQMCSLPGPSQLTYSATQSIDVDQNSEKALDLMLR